MELDTLDTFQCAVFRQSVGNSRIRFVTARHGLCFKHHRQFDKIQRTKKAGIAERDNVQFDQLQRVCQPFLTVEYRLLIPLIRADNVLTEWAALEAASTKIYNSLSSAMQPAFFQLVHHPVIASNNVAKMVCS